MKKTLVSAILGLAAVASVQAQGNINLYNYVSGGTQPNAILYGVGSGGTLGAPVVQGVGGTWTVGFYIAPGSQVGNVILGGATDIPTGGGLVLATGQGATTPLGDFEAGEYSAASEYTTSVIGGTVTVVVVAYNGASYATSSVRGHSQAFTMLTTAATESAALTGTFMNGFSVAAVPEPSTFALAGLGLAGLLIFRRRK